MIDLRNCKEGDTLISSQGVKLVYLRRTEGIEYLDHVVKYDDGETGTRTHDGFVFKYNRMPWCDHDIVEVIPKEKNV